MNVFVPGPRLLRPAVVMLLVTGLCGCGKKTEVRVVEPRRGDIEESFSEPGRTRLPSTYRVIMPLDGRIGRIDLEPGDRVTSGQELAEFDRTSFEAAVAEARASVSEMQSDLRLNAFNALEQIALLETRAFIEATSETLKAADAQVEAERARAERASREMKRVQELTTGRTVAQTEYEDTKLQAETSIIELRQQEFIRAALNALAIVSRLGPETIEQWLSRKKLQREGITERLAQANARLARAEHELELASITSPINGVVLEKFHDGGGSLSRGEQLLLIGDTRELEVITDVLTQDAMRLTRQTRVSYESGLRSVPFTGIVKRVEPAAFTKTSSLGIEQQRVNVISAITETPPGLGVGYRVEARYYTGTAKSAVIVPRFTVIQAPDNSFYVWVVDGDRLKKVPVEIGVRSDLEMQVTKGLDGKERLVANPDSSLKAGTAVKVVDGE